MADEKKNTKPPMPAEGAKSAEAAPAAEGSKSEEGKKDVKKTSADSPWLPVLVVIIILPILSFVMTESVIIPRVKKALGDITKIQQENLQPAHGGPLPTAHKEEKKEGGKEGEKADSNSAKFENVVANLSGSMKSRFVKVSFVIEGDEEEFKETIEKNRTKIIDSALGILGALTVTELDEPGTKNIVRSDLINGFNQVLGKTLVKRLYFAEFVIQ